MAKIKTLKDYNDEIIYPQSTTRAIVNAEGVNLDTLHSKFVMMEQISEIEDINNEYENTINKVTIVDNFSTDLQYPSAKAVYDFVNNQQIEIDLSEYAKIVDIPANEEDPTVPNHVKTITEENISNWNNKAEISAIPNITSQSTDLEAGVSELATGHIVLVYEE